MRKLITLSFAAFCLVILGWVSWRIAHEYADPKNEGIRMGSAAKQLWLALRIASEARSSAGESPVWPQQSDGDRTSTAFLARASSQNWLPTFTTRDFGGKTLPSPATTNLADFTAANNAWCITLDCGQDTPPDTPFLFSRNFCQARSARWRKPPSYGRRLSDIRAFCPWTRPFGRHFGVVVTWGGSVRVISGKALAQPDGPCKYFNPTGADLPFLHP